MKVIELIVILLISPLFDLTRSTGLNIFIIRLSLSLPLASIDLYPY